MDAVAERQTQLTPTPWLSVDWDVWQAEGHSTDAAVNAALAQFAIAPADGVEAARRLFEQLPGSRVVVSTGDLATRIRQQPRAFVMRRPPSSSPPTASGDAASPSR